LNGRYTAIGDCGHFAHVCRKFGADKKGSGFDLTLVEDEVFFAGAGR